MAEIHLPALVAKVRMNSDGVESAVSNLTKSFAGGDLAMAGVAAGLGLIVLGGKSMMAIADAQERANRSLDQSWTGGVSGLKEYKTGIASFIGGNQRYIKSQAEVTEGFASLTRSGWTPAKLFVT
jgi:hypothetical protein